MSIEIFDPPMCCPTGICGPSVDPVLVKIQEAILELKKNGVEVERYSMTHHMQKFMGNESVAQLINEQGSKVLPITLVNGNVFKTGSYPSYDELRDALQRI